MSSDQIIPLNSEDEFNSDLPFVEPPEDIVRLRTGFATKATKGKFTKLHIYNSYISFLNILTLNMFRSSDCFKRKSS